jgi:hypothetical protein
VCYNPNPLYPLPLEKGKGKRFWKRGFAPLRHPVYVNEKLIPRRVFAPCDPIIDNLGLSEAVKIASKIVPLSIGRGGRKCGQ